MTFCARSQSYDNVLILRQKSYHHFLDVL